MPMKFFLFFLVFFCSLAYSTCDSQYYPSNSGAVYMIRAAYSYHSGGCSGNTLSCSNLTFHENCDFLISQVHNNHYIGSATVTDLKCAYNIQAAGDGCGTASYYGEYFRCYITLCGTQTEADSVRCAVSPNAVGCEDKCVTYREQCEKLGGVFTGRNTNTGCAASCNTCGTAAQKNIMDIKIRSCCSQALAPSVDRMCFTSDIASGDGMQVSTNANLECVDPNVDSDNMNLYVEYCSDEEPGSSDSNLSSSEGGSAGGGESSEAGSSGEEYSSSAGGDIGDYNYYPILDTIRDSLVYIKHDVHTIATCLLTPGACSGLNPQVEVNVPSDSSYIKQVNNSVNTQTDILDSSLRNGNERIRNSIASANDTLIDSLRKFLAAGDGSASIDTLHNIHSSMLLIAGAVASKFGYDDTSTSTLREELKGYFTGVQVDTGSVGFANNFIVEGENLADSIGRAIGWLGGLDTVDVDSVFAAGVGDSAGLDSIENFVNDSLAGLADSLNGVIVAQNDSIKRGLPDSLDVWSDSLIAYSPFASFDSLIFGQLGAKIPNSNECPEDCSKWSINLPRFGLFNFTVDYGLCLGRLPFGGMNALGFVRLLLRLITVWSCIWIVFNGLTRRKD